MRVSCRDVLRNAERLPRPSARGSRARRSRCCLLSGRPMIDALLDLPPHIRKRLASALESGSLALPYSPASLQSVVGIREGGEDVVGALQALERLGVSAAAAAVWIRSLEA